MKRAWLYLLVSMVIMLANPAWSTVLYNQPTNFNGAFASQNDTNSLGNFATTYDNFTIPTLPSTPGKTWRVEVEGIRLVGSYFNPPMQGTMTGMTVDFWSDNSGQPGTLLASFFATGTNHETFLQLDNVGDPTYSYYQVIDFFGMTGTQYWVSVVPDVGLPPQWGWETGTGGDGIAYQDFFGVRSQISSDLAFALDGVIITPEPASLSMVTFGLALIGSARYRWKRK